MFWNCNKNPLKAISLDSLQIIFLKKNLLLVNDLEIFRAELDFYLAQIKFKQ